MQKPPAGALVMYGTFRCAALTAVLIAVSSSSEAKVVTGELNFTGTVVFSSTLVDFTPGPLGTGSAPIVAGSGGTFTTLVGSLAIVRDIPIPSAGGILHANTLHAGPPFRFATAARGTGNFRASPCAPAASVGASR